MSSAIHLEWCFNTAWSHESSVGEAILLEGETETTIVLIKWHLDKLTISVSLRIGYCINSTKCTYQILIWNIKYKRLAGSWPANDYHVQLHMFSVIHNYAGLDNSTILQFFTCLLTYYVKYLFNSTNCRVQKHMSINIFILVLKGKIGHTIIESKNPDCFIHMI